MLKDVNIIYHQNASLIPHLRDKSCRNRSMMTSTPCLNKFQQLNLCNNNCAMCTATISQYYLKDNACIVRVTDVIHHWKIPY